MPVTSTDNKVIYAGDDVTTVFAYAFKIFAASELTVEEILISTGAVTALVLNTDYTVSGAGTASGGNVTLLGGSLASAKNLSIRRVLPLTQEKDLEDNSPTPAAVTEEVYDRDVMIAQQQQEQIDRSLKIDSSQSGISVILPAPEANKFWGWDAAGTAPENKTASDLSAVEKASTVDAEAGTDDDDYMTPAKVKSQIQKSGGFKMPLANLEAIASQVSKPSPVEADIMLIEDSADSNARKRITIKDLQTAKGYVQFTGAASIQGSYNVSGVADNGTGNYQVTWDTDFANDDYACVASMELAATGNGGLRINSPLAGSVTILTYNDTPASADADMVHVIAFGDQ